MDHIYKSLELFDLIVVGGGASGFMASITASERGLDHVCILEGTSKTLEKVRISGGGRCNITNSVWENSDLVTNYPRGQKPLLGLFSHFSTLQAFNWFQERGLKLKIEDDGRVFPSTNSSRDVLSCLQQNAINAGVVVHTKKLVTLIERIKQKYYLVKIKNNPPLLAKNVLLATGGSPSGSKIAKTLGHEIIKPVPSLFTFAINNRFLKECKGITIADVQVKLNTSSQKYVEIGDVLITHWGLSGPAILKLSAFAARSLNEDSYKAELKINWVGCSVDEVNDKISQVKVKFRNKLLVNSKPFIKIPKRLWLFFLQQIGLSPDLSWANISRIEHQKIVEIVVSSSFQITNKGAYGEEFVTAGGVCLDEVNLKTMESKKSKGLYFAGEILNIDGVTGGFNFQHCWTSGWIAGNSVAQS